MTEAGYVGRLQTVKISQKVSVASLTLQKMDKAFESLEQCLLEVIIISDSSRKHLFGNKDSSADQYSFTSLAKSGGKSHLTLH